MNNTVRLYLYLVFCRRQDVVRGVMGWKRFPSQGLTSLGYTPTLTNVWVPRWNDDVFEQDMLPSELPTLQQQLGDDDKANIGDDRCVRVMVCRGGWRSGSGGCGVE